MNNIYFEINKFWNKHLYSSVNLSRQVRSRLPSAVTGLLECSGGVCQPRLQWRLRAEDSSRYSRRDSQSVRALVPDVKVRDRGFHNITLLDMGDIAGPNISIADLSLLCLQWPVPVVSDMAWVQPELEQLRHVCKKRYRGTQADMCSYCGKRIKLDMSRHVANYHLELSQLWRCPMSWYTIWKGTPQDCVDHLRLAHAVPV